MSVAPYGVAIHNAIARDDVRRLDSLIEQAKRLQAAQGGDLSKAIRAGEAALKRLRKPAAGTKARATSAKKGRSRK